MKRVLVLLILLGACTSSTYANYDTLVAFTGVGPTETAHIWGGGQNGLYVYSGVLNLTVDGQSRPGFCVDLTKEAAQSPTLYEPISVQNYLGPEKAMYFTELYNKHYSTNWTNVEASAFQMSVWEIIYENVPKNAGMYDVTIDGTDGQMGFFCSGPTTKMANSWLHLLDGTGPRVPVTIVQSKLYQNYAIASVPEPSTLVLLLLCTPLAFGKMVNRWRRTISR